MSALLSCILALSLGLGVQGHGFMAIPKSRNVISRTDHYCPHCFNSGGTGAVSANSGGVWPYPETLESTARHGICGDPAGDDTHAYPGSVVETYVSGGKIEIKVGVTAHHNGHFEFFLCDTADLTDSNGPVTQECLNRHQLKRSAGVAASHKIDSREPGRYYLDPKCSMESERFGDAGIEAYTASMTYDLPEGITCEHCVLQMYWITANSCLAPGYREYFGSADAPASFSECSGDGGSSGWWAPHLGDCRAGSYPEEFWNCADIRIIPGDGSAPPLPTPPPTSLSTTAPPTVVDTLPPSPAATSSAPGMAKRIVAYVPNWKACPGPEQLEHYTHALVAFAVTYPAWKPAGQDTCGTERSCTVQSVPGCGGKTLKEMVDYLHENGVQAIVSFGGASMGGVWETKGAAGSNSCWEHCLGKVDSLVSQLQGIVQQSGADGIDVDYEYFLDEPKYRTFLSDLTDGLRTALPSPLLLTHAPMDPDLCTTGIHSGCRREYYDILAAQSDKVDFIMPQYYNGYQRPAQDFSSALRHYNALVSGVFQGDASKVVFGFCVSDCSSFNVNAAAALGVVRSLEEAVPENGGAMFWESSADGAGAWSGPIAELLLEGGGANPTPPPTATQPPSPSSSSGGPGCSGEPCFVTTQCRSEWGWCGTSSEYCNARSTWSADCLLGEDAPTTPPPTTTTTTDLGDNDVPAGSFVAQHGKLRLEGVQLVDESGEEIQLVGMSSHGLHWFRDCYTKESIAFLVETWGITLFRAAMYIGEGGYATDPSVQAMVEDIVRWTEELGVYVMIDWHVLTPGDPNAWLDGSGASTGLAIDFWREMATKYQGKKHVLYEIANEPNNVDWSTVKKYHDAVIGEIRKIDSETIIIAGTTTWSQDIHLAAQNPVSQPYNVMYAFHFYAGTHESLLQRVRETAPRIPLFATEWGTSEATGNGDLNLGVARQFLDVFAEFKIGWAQWSWADKNEKSAALQPGACATKSWDAASTSGAFVRDYIKQATGGGDGATPPPSSPPTTAVTLPPGTMPPTTMPPTTSSSPPIETSSPPTSSSFPSSCEHLVKYAVQDSWSSGYNVDLIVEAGPSGLASGWSASWVLGQGNKFSAGWNANFDYDKATRTVKATPAAWQSNLAPGATATLGFTVAGGLGELPSMVSVGGDECVVGGGAVPTESPPPPATMPPSAAATPPPTEETTMGPDAELVAQIISLLEQLRELGDAETASTAQSLIDELNKLGPSASITPELASMMSSALMTSYPGRGLPTNPLDEDSKEITNELLRSLDGVGESRDEEDTQEGNGDEAILGLSPVAFVGVVAGSACALLLAVGLTVALVKKRKSHDKIPTARGGAEGVVVGKSELETDSPV